MGEKKQPGRFTLQFNMEDPQQKKVSEFLEQQGRHKAQFITSAVLQYMQPAVPKESTGDMSAIDKDTLVRMLLSIMEKSQFTTSLPGGPTLTTKAPAQTSSKTKGWDNPVGDDALMAISETLAAFQQK